MLKHTRELLIEIAHAIRKNIYAFIIITFFSLPLIGKLFHLENYSFFELLGQKEEIIDNKFSIESFNNKTFQKKFEKKLGYSLTWTNIYIKNFNTIMFYVFNKSYGDENTLVIGKDKYIFGTNYFKTYMSDLRYDEIQVEKMQQTINDLKLLQDYLKKRNKLLILTIAPNKAVICMDKIPVRYLKYNKYKRADKDYYVFMKILNESGLNYVNTRDYLNQIKSKEALFEKDDVSWSFYAAFVIAQKVIEKINHLEDYTIQQLQIDKIIKHKTPSPTSLSADLLNIYFIPKDYNYEELILKKNTIASDKKLAVIGGCFNDKIVTILSEANSFSNIENYNAYSIISPDDIKYSIVHSNAYPNHSVSEEDKTMTSKELMPSLLKNDIIIIDLNESFLLHIFLDVYIPEMKKYLKENP